MLYTERDALFQNSMNFSAHISMFWHYYLENKKPTFLACIPKQVYALIWNLQKMMIFFRTVEPTFARSWKILEELLFFCSRFI